MILLLEIATEKNLETLLHKDLCQTLAYLAESLQINYTTSLNCWKV